ncbi:hypothetical protein [Pseudomonas sp. WS 5414]|uniref:hypothetical protein n=1 Tax=Pseudomonas sp. WS 5414 TaxID=2717478 RepID=UPI0014729513|nr:hypothetical protein [Pseudomonas sp. WS 5414]NMY67287.1 hypothetical protein [Pseudomonas sp. WS 5414]
MARQEINLGVLPNGVGGDTPRVANTKINDMTEEVYERIATVENSLSGKIEKTSVGAPDGVASLDHDGKVPSTQLPSAPAGPSSTDDLPEGSTNQYFTQPRVHSTTLAGLGALVNAAIVAGDTLLQAFAKLQGQLNVKLGKGEVAADSDKLGGQPADFYTTLMAGATATAGGVKGLVPAPAAGDQAKFLTGAGTYAAPSTTQTSWGGIAGLISDQADLKAALDAKVAIAGLGLSKKWSSGPISWSVAGILNLTHNLGFEPAIVVVKGRYKAAVNGMAIGESEFSVGILYQSAFLGVIARKPTTTTLQIQVARDGLRLSNAAGELVAVTPAQVDLVVELWA